MVLILILEKDFPVSRSPRYFQVCYGIIKEYTIYERKYRLLVKTAPIALGALDIFMSDVMFACPMCKTKYSVDDLHIINA